jgi:acetyl/propionyl-CoA carboxylase alpha subunit
VGVDYDPLIAKVVAAGPGRGAALRTLRAALAALQVAGLPTNAAFVQRVCDNAEFAGGRGVDTSFIERHEAELLAPAALDPGAAALAAATYARADARAARAAAAAAGEPPLPGPWAAGDAFRVNHTHRAPAEFVHAGSGAGVRGWVEFARGGALEVCAEALGPEPVRVAQAEVGDDWVRAEVGGRRVRGSWCIHRRAPPPRRRRRRCRALKLQRLRRAAACCALEPRAAAAQPSRRLAAPPQPRRLALLRSHGDEEVLDLWEGGRQHQFRRAVARRWARRGGAAASARAVASPMPGKVVQVLVAAGQAVEAGQRLCVVEAMKMEHAVVAPHSGVAEELHAFEGSQVEEGQALALVAEAAEGGAEAAAAA